MTFIHFGMRMEIEKLFLEWCEKNQIAKLPNSMIVFMLEKDWLNKKKIVEDLAEQTEDSLKIPNNCKYLTNPSGNVWECGCCLEIYCEHQIYDRNPDGTLNIVKCGFESKTPGVRERKDNE